MISLDTRGKKVAGGAMLIALALIFSYIEFLLPINLGIPGIKIGISNIVIVLTLYLFGFRFAIIVNIIRILLSSLLFTSFFATLYGLSGGILSLIIMALFKKTNKFSLIGVSVAGGVFHNLGQLIVAALVISNIKLFFYFPVLLISGIASGTLVGLITFLILKKTSPFFGRNDLLN